MPNPVPLLLLGGAALLLMGKKKKKPSSEKVEEEPDVELMPEPEEATEPVVPPDEAEDIPIPPPPTEDPTDALDADATLTDDEEEALEEGLLAGKSLKAKCDEFIDAVYVEDVEEGELHINEVAVEESIIPALYDYIKPIAIEKGKEVKVSDIGSDGAIVGLDAVAPGCNFKVKDMAWYYADNKPLSSKATKILYGVYDIMEEVIDQINKELGYTFVLQAQKVDDGGGGMQGGNIQGG